MWHFDAEDEVGNVRILVTFNQGSPFDVEYRRRYFAFLNKPTRRPPVLPAELPTVSLLVWEKGQTVARFAYRYPADAFDASPDGPELRVGPHQLVRGAGGTLALALADVPIDGGATRVSAELWFTPRFAFAPMVKRFPSRHAVGADHFWVIANPLCAVSGTIRISDVPSSSSPMTPLPPHEIHFAGRGYHDHRYGSAPLHGPSSVTWVRGRALFDDRAEAFQYVAGGAEGCCIRADANGIHDVTPTTWEPRGGDLERVTLHDGLMLESPTEVDLNPIARSLAYEAVRAGRREGSALCETARHGFSFPMRAGDFEDAP
jgi:hypothetical protein